MLKVLSGISDMCLADTMKQILQHVCNHILSLFAVCCEVNVILFNHYINHKQGYSFNKKVNVLPFCTIDMSHRPGKCPCRRFSKFLQ